MLDLHSFYCRCCMLAHVQAALYDASKRRRTVETVRGAKNDHSADAGNSETRHVDSGNR